MGEIAPQLFLFYGEKYELQKVQKRAWPKTPSSFLKQDGQRARILFIYLPISPFEKGESVGNATE